MRRFGRMQMGLALICSWGLAWSQNARGQARQQTAQQQQMAYAPRVEIKPPPNSKAQLSRIGFVVLRNDRGYPKEAARCYRLWQHDHYPVVVTSDFALHSLHLLCSWCQRFLEISHLRGDLLDLTDVMLAEMAHRATDQEAAAELRKGAMTCAAFLLVAKRLLAGGDLAGMDPVWSKRIKGELDLIAAAAGPARSPLFGYLEDYSQYQPRGHYARTPAFASYFRAMTWYGRMAFRLDQQGTLRALLLVDTLDRSKVKGEKAMSVWKRIYDTTAFFAGRSDDLTPVDYLQAAGAGAGVSRLLADPAGRQSYLLRLRKMRRPRILSTYALSPAAGGKKWQRSTAGMRLFGTRYSLDSEIFQRLTFDEVGAYTGPAKGAFTLVNVRGASVRGFPRGLDVAAVLGSNVAGELLRQRNDDRYEGYPQAVNTLRSKIADFAPTTWTTDLYACRLAAVRLLVNPPPGRQSPAPLQSRAWHCKQLATALGAWTELRHDTILYTKQSYTAMQCSLAAVKGEHEQRRRPPPPRGYVEPVPEVYAVARATVMIIKRNLVQLGFPKDRALTRALDLFARTLGQLQEIARKELSGQGLSANDYKVIENIGSTLMTPRYGFPHDRDVSERFMAEMDCHMPVVADVHTNLDARMVLEEAVGQPATLYLLAPVEGKPTLCVGVVYDYYEFKQPLARRLTDEAWRKMLETGGNRHAKRTHLGAQNGPTCCQVYPAF